MCNQQEIFALLGLDDVLAERQEEARYRNNHLSSFKKRLRQNMDPFHVLLDKFLTHYRLTKSAAQDLIDLLEPLMEAGTASRLSIKTRILIALRVFATGGYQNLVAQDFLHPTCQGSVSNCFDEVTEVLYEIAPRIISFPKTREERWATQRKFRKHIRIPGILGLVDCIIVKFLKPHENEESFYNFKHGHAMNVQVVCDSNHIITDLRICPGSNNDQGIWNHSKIKTYMEQIRNEGQYYLLGDSGYTPSPILLTPIHDAAPNSPEAVYTREHCGTRCRIEQLFGLWTNVWRIIKRERAMRYTPVKVGKIIVASAVLHNFRIMNRIDDDADDDEESNDADDHSNMDVNEEEQEFEAGPNNYQEGILERAELIDNFYS